MDESSKNIKIQELEAIKERLLDIANELMVVSDSHVYTSLHLNEAKNVLTRVQREIEKVTSSSAPKLDV